MKFRTRATAANPSPFGVGICSWRGVVGAALVLAFSACAVGCTTAANEKETTSAGADGAAVDGSGGDGSGGDGLDQDAAIGDTHQVDIQLPDAMSDATFHEDGQTQTDSKTSDAGGPGDGQCHAWAAPVEVGKVQALAELSGLALSQGGGLWAHNDSGEVEARVLLLDTDAALRAVLHIPGIKPVDWEDMAAGPCGQGLPAKTRCLWIGDIGDNGHKRSVVSVIRVVEPAALLTGLPSASTVTHWNAAKGDVAVTPFRYPAEANAAATVLRPDAEALAVLSDGRLLVATKRDDGLSRLFRVTPNPAATSPVVAELIGTLDVRDPPLVQGVSLQVTGADLVGDRRLLVRSYFRAWAIDVPTPLTGPTGTLQAMFGSATGGPARTKLTTGFDIQAESIASDGKGGFWHTSELKSQPLWHVPCSP